MEMIRRQKVARFKAHSRAMILAAGLQTQEDFDEEDRLQKLCDREDDRDPLEGCVDYDYPLRSQDERNREGSDDRVEERPSWQEQGRINREVDEMMSDFPGRFNEAPLIEMMHGNASGSGSGRDA